MCLPAYQNDSQARTRIRRRLAAMAILLITFSLAIGLLHPQSGTEAGLIDFLRGLTLGIGLVFSMSAYTLCVRRPQANS